MHVDFANWDPAQQYDVCIVGSGPAGMTLALELQKSGHKIALIEGGDTQYSFESQSIYQGELSGDPYFDLSICRLRQLGGTSGHWAGFCRTLDEQDFEPKPGIDVPGWPIRKADMDPYLAAAMKILEMDPIQPSRPLSEGLTEKIYYGYSKPVRFADQYGETLKSSAHIHLFLQTSLVSFETQNQRISSVSLQHLDGSQKPLKARQYILATGGIENSRLLLWGNQQTNGELVKEPKTLGRYWMEHPHFSIGEAIMKTDYVFEKDGRGIAYYASSAALQEQKQVLNAVMRMVPESYKGSKKIAADLACMAPDLGAWVFEQLGKRLVCGVRIFATWEQQPNFNSYIELSEEVDGLGIPRSRLHWEKTDLDKKSIREAALALGEQFVRQGIGRVRLQQWLLDNEDFPVNDGLGGYHHMGGTRMADRAEEGVVDRNCRVFGQDNLYVAGSSVFVRGGYANPTLPLVQLSLRLADHLNRRLADHG